MFENDSDGHRTKETRYTASGIKSEEFTFVVINNVSRCQGEKIYDTSTQELIRIWINTYNDDGSYNTRTRYDGPNESDKVGYIDNFIQENVDGWVIKQTWHEVGSSYYLVEYYEHDGNRNTRVKSEYHDNTSHNLFRVRTFVRFGNNTFTKEDIRYSDNGLTTTSDLVNIYDSNGALIKVEKYYSSKELISWADEIVQDSNYQTRSELWHYNANSGENPDRTRRKFYSPEGYQSLTAYYWNGELTGYAFSDIRDNSSSFTKTHYNTNGSLNHVEYYSDKNSNYAAKEDYYSDGVYQNTVELNTSTGTTTTDYYQSGSKIVHTLVDTVYIDLPSSWTGQTCGKTGCAYVLADYNLTENTYTVKVDGNVTTAGVSGNKIEFGSGKLELSSGTHTIRVTVHNTYGDFSASVTIAVV